MLKKILILLVAFSALFLISNIEEAEAGGCYTQGEVCPASSSRPACPACQWGSWTCDDAGYSPCAYGYSKKTCTLRGGCYDSIEEVCPPECPETSGVSLYICCPDNSYCIKNMDQGGANWCCSAKSDILCEGGCRELSYGVCCDAKWFSVGSGTWTGKCTDKTTFDGYCGPGLTCSVVTRDTGHALICKGTSPALCGDSCYNSMTQECSDASKEKIVMKAGGKCSYDSYKKGISCEGSTKTETVPCTPKVLWDLYDGYDLDTGTFYDEGRSKGDIYLREVHEFNFGRLGFFVYHTVLANGDARIAVSDDPDVRCSRARYRTGVSFYMKDRDDEAPLVYLCVKTDQGNIYKLNYFNRGFTYDTSCTGDALCEGSDNNPSRCCNPSVTMPSDTADTDYFCDSSGNLGKEVIKGTCEYVNTCSIVNPISVSISPEQVETYPGAKHTFKVTVINNMDFSYSPCIGGITINEPVLYDKNMQEKTAWKNNVKKYTTGLTDFPAYKTNTYDLEFEVPAGLKTGDEVIINVSASGSFASAIATLLVVDGTPPEILITTTPKSPCDIYPSFPEEACDTEVSLDCQDSESGCDKDTLGYIIYPKEDYPTEPTCPETGYTTYASPFLLTDWTWLCTKAQDYAGNVNKTLFEIKIDKTLIVPKLIAEESLTIGLGEEGLIPLTIWNTFPVSNSIDLNIHSITTIGDSTNPARYWLWFEGQRDGDRFNWNSGEMDGDSQTLKNIIINGFKLGTYTFKVTASYPQYPEIDSTTVEVQVNVVQSGEGFFAKAPGLNSYAFILIVIIASLVVWRKK